MEGLSYPIEVSIGFPDGLMRGLALAVENPEALFPNQIGALARIAQATHQKWLSYATSNEPLPSGETLRPWSGQYARSIKLEETEPYHYRIYSDDIKARVIEEGKDAWDLHEVLATSRKVRRSKTGALYLVIPFRHGVPGAVVVGEYSGRTLSDDVYERAKELAPSRATGSRTEQAIHQDRYPGESVERLTYQWGDRMTLSDLGTMGYDTSEPETQRMANMVRFDTSTGAQNRSSYVTFRTLSQSNSAGSWVIPERQGRYVAKATAEWLMARYPEIMRRAQALDIEHVKALSGAA